MNISFEIAQILIESHEEIRKQFKGAIKKNGLKSNDFNDKYYSKKLNKYLFKQKAFKKIEISRMDFVGKTRGINKSQPICPAKCIDDYLFRISGDPSLIYNGKYRRCLFLSDTTIGDNGEISFISPKKYNKLEFDKKRLNIWINEDDMIHDKNSNMFIPNKKLKYIRCLTRDQYNSSHCFWRLHCLKLNKHGKMNEYLAKNVGQHRMDENSKDCIQYLGIVHNWRSRNGGHTSSKEILPEYYEYPCGKCTIWRQIEGVSFVSAHMALCYNEFCNELPQLNNLGMSSNTIKCDIVQSQSKIFWNNKFINNLEKKMDYKQNKNESKYIYYLIFIWLNQLIYKTALDHGFNFRKINKQFCAPHFYYKEHWNPLAKHLQKQLFKGRIKFYGKDIYFKHIESSSSSPTSSSSSSTPTKIANENDIIQIVDKLIHCLHLKLQNKDNKQWISKLNDIKLTPSYIQKK